MGEEIPGLDLEEELNFIHKDCVETYKLGRERGRKAEREELEELVKQRLSSLQGKKSRLRTYYKDDDDPLDYDDYHSVINAINVRIGELERLLDELDLEDKVKL